MLRVRRGQVKTSPDSVQSQIDMFFNVRVDDMLSVVPLASMRLVLACDGSVVDQVLSVVANDGYCLVPGSVSVDLPHTKLYRILDYPSMWVDGMFPPNEVFEFTLIAKGRPSIRARRNWMSENDEVKFVKDVVLMLTREGDNVLALEFGTCGALLACISGNRRFYGCESDTKRYYDTVACVLTACSVDREAD